MPEPKNNQHYQKLKLPIRRLKIDVAEFRNFINRFSIDNPDGKVITRKESLFEPEHEIELFHYVKDVPSKQFSFFELEISDESKVGNNYNNITHEFILFLKTASSIYALSTGSAYTRIDQYLDISYPFEVLYKIGNRSIKTITTRNATGLTYNQKKNYSKGIDVNSIDNTGSVIQNIKSDINRETLITNNLEFLKLQNGNGATIDVGISIKLGRNLLLTNYFDTIIKLENIELTQDDHDAWELTRGLKKILTKSKKDELNLFLAQELVHSALNDGYDALFGFDICDPAHDEDFFHGYDYYISQDIISEQSPKINEIIDYLKTILQFTDIEEGINAIFHLYIRYNVDGDNHHRVKLFDCLHGEINYLGATYFLIDRVWYEVDKKYLLRLKNRFENTIVSNMLAPSLNFLLWESENEMDYNLKYKNLENWVFSDRILCDKTSNLHGIELFDLAYIDDSQRIIYIIQVKDGFSGSIRDATSQIRMSFEYFQSLHFDPNSTHWRNYLEKLSEAQNDLFGFENKIKTYDRVFVIACSTNSEFENHMQRNDVSNIAIDEILALHYHIARNGDKPNMFKLINIPKQ